MIGHTIEISAGLPTMYFISFSISASVDAGLKIVRNASSPGDRCVSEGIAELFGWFFVALSNTPSVDHDIMLASHAINANRTK
jgi:hypothetical protein